MNVLIKNLEFNNYCWLRSRENRELLDSLYLAYDSFKVKDVEVLAVIANKVQPENIELVTNGLKKSLPKSILVNSIPLIHNLNNPTVQEIVKLDAKVLFGSAHLNNQTGILVWVPCNCVIICCI
jgi:hypothetical protein